jgi:hypothetical protein
MRQDDSLRAMKLSVLILAVMLLLASACSPQAARTVQQDAGSARSPEPATIQPQPTSTMTPAPEVLPPPGGFTPGVGSTFVMSDEITLKWEAVRGAAEYQVEVWEEGKAPFVLCDWQPDSACSLGLFLPGKIYWRVRARSGSQESAWGNTLFLTLQPKPTNTVQIRSAVMNPPTHLKPENNAVIQYSSDYTFQWEPVHGAVEYRFEFKETSSKGWMAPCGEWANHTSCGTRLWAGKFEWRVKARQGKNEGEWSKPWRITIVDDRATATPIPPLPNPPAPVGPANGARFYAPVVVEMTWNALPGATEYCIEFKDQLTNTVFSCITWVSETSYQIGFQDANTWEWRVKARNRYYESPWSSMRSFTIVEDPRPKTATAPPPTLTPKPTATPKGSGD